MNKILTTIIVVAILIGGLYFVSQGTAVCGVTNGDVTVHYYDAQGKPVCGDTLSVVNSVKGVSAIDLTVKVSNDPTSIPLFCDMTSVKVNGATGTVFDSAMTRRTLNLQPSDTEEWTSNVFSVSSFESAPTPDIFNVSVLCQYVDSTGNHPLAEKSASIPLTITADGTGSFQVNVNPPGGLPDKYCGNNVCDSGETTSNCPVDCISSTTSNFRTSDLSYPQGSAIGYTASCGSTLTKFGYESSSCWAVTGSTCPVYAGYTRVLTTKTVPGRPFWSNSGTPTCVYTKDGDITRMAVAFQVLTTGGSPCSTIGQWGAVNYITSSSYANNVDIRASTINVNKETICP